MEGWKDCIGSLSSLVPPTSEVDLIKENLMSPESRHLMIISHNCAASHILFSGNKKLLSNHKEVRILEGPLFPGDGGDQHIHYLLRVVRESMAKGSLLVLINLNIISFFSKNLLHSWSTFLHPFSPISSLCPFVPFLPFPLLLFGLFFSSSLLSLFS